MKTWHGFFEMIPLLKILSVFLLLSGIVNLYLNPYYSFAELLPNRYGSSIWRWRAKWLGWSLFSRRTLR